MRLQEIWIWLSLKALVLYSVAPGHQLFCLLILMPEFFSLTLSYFSGFEFKQVHCGLARAGAPAETTDPRSREHSSGGRWWLHMPEKGLCGGSNGREEEKLGGEDE